MLWLILSVPGFDKGCVFGVFLGLKPDFIPTLYLPQTYLLEVQIVEIRPPGYIAPQKKL